MDKTNVIEVTISGPKGTFIMSHPDITVLSEMFSVLVELYEKGPRSSSNEPV